ncbi:sugar phosphate isomerase/epimerase [Oceanobacillus zhaokaii]|uniref:Sugar phosphate isomerase/epimerase n=1 Tax=Oceanobacillus zhaokaii TaxID=2052660 RepID=A0A345PKF5_9BACI|nr:sugar phosphate isomerase/epimerase family protein [Oceanobacillus zhaokaii]AXI10485.1 sugar phosphate isomerase/epimerase [Oceanobacillus zhaokaii]
MKKRIGLCFWTFGPLSFEEKCQIAVEIGVAGVEVEGDLTQSPSELKKILEKYSLLPFSVTPANVDISNTNEEARSSAINYYFELISWAKELGAHRICLHGDVGKIKSSGDVDFDWNLLVDSTKKIISEAEKVNLPIVYEVLNRYENYQVITANEARRLCKEVDNEYLSILLDSYHMNIDEPDPLEALRIAGDKLGIYHLADSNRLGVGEGHANLKDQLDVLDEIGYEGPIIMEMTALGENPFTPVKQGDYLNQLINSYKKSVEFLNKRVPVRY